jgi:hypothetical protein
MSRNITISYDDPAGNDINIELRPPYFILGTQQTSLQFWSIPRLKEIGLNHLTILGQTDPVHFRGWDDMTVLAEELHLLATHLQSIDFHPELKAEWLSHLTYCYHLLVATTPADCTPKLGIG